METIMMLQPELQRRIFNYLDPIPIMLVHKTCRQFRDHRYWEQMIPLYLFNEIFDLELFYIYKRAGIGNVIFNDWQRYNLREEYIYCLREQINQLMGDYVRWDCWYWSLVDPEILCNAKAHEAALFRRLHDIGPSEYITYYKNNMTVKALI